MYVLFPSHKRRFKCRYCLPNELQRGVPEQLISCFYRSKLKFFLSCDLRLMCSDDCIVFVCLSRCEDPQNTILTERFLQLFREATANSFTRHLRHTIWGNVPDLFTAEAGVPDQLVLRRLCSIANYDQSDSYLSDEVDFHL